MSKSLNSNLKYSKDACDHVLKKSALKGANWDQYRGVATSWESCIGRFGNSKQCVPLKDSLDVCVYDVVRPKVKVLAKGKTRINHIQIIANTVKKNKCGNCGEFSALAFYYLYDLGVRPLDWMSLVGGDHAFVLIGRTKGDVNQVKSWGPAAAICDPWGQGFRNGDSKTGTYAASDFAKQMGGLVSFTGVRSLHREN